MEHSELRFHPLSSEESICKLRGEGLFSGQFIPQKEASQWLKHAK
jgi:hypothetical protein